LRIIRPHDCAIGIGGAVIHATRGLGREGYQWVDHQASINSRHRYDQIGGFVHARSEGYGMDVQGVQLPGYLIADVDGDVLGEEALKLGIVGRIVAAHQHSEVLGNGRLIDFSDGLRCCEAYCAKNEQRKHYG